jgi:hypothetical protein
LSSRAGGGKGGHSPPARPFLRSIFFHPLSFSLPCRRLTGRRCTAWKKFLHSRPAVVPWPMAVPAHARTHARTLARLPRSPFSGGGSGCGSCLLLGVWGECMYGPILQAMRKGRGHASVWARIGKKSTVGGVYTPWPSRPRPRVVAGPLGKNPDARAEADRRTDDCVDYPPEPGRTARGCLGRPRAAASRGPRADALGVVVVVVVVVEQWDRRTSFRPPAATGSQKSQTGTMPQQCARQTVDGDDEERGMCRRQQSLPLRNSNHAAPRARHERLAAAPEITK